MSTKEDLCVATLMCLVALMNFISGGRNKSVANMLVGWAVVWLQILWLLK